MQKYELIRWWLAPTDYSQALMSNWTENKYAHHHSYVIAKKVFAVQTGFSQEKGLLQELCWSNLQC